MKPISPKSDISKDLGCQKLQVHFPQNPLHNLHREIFLGSGFSANTGAADAKELTQTSLCRHAKHIHQLTEKGRAVSSTNGMDAPT